MDARNHGNSPHVPHMDYNFMCQDLVLFSKEKELTDSTVIGMEVIGKGRVENTVVCESTQLKKAVEEPSSSIKMSLCMCFKRYVLFC